MTNRRILIAPTIMIITSALLVGCNTVRGMGQDLQRGGEKISQVAEETRKKL